LDDADFPKQISRTSLGSVPVFFAEGPPPPQAALIFRVGRVDERLSTSGITHLVEHLALFPIGDQPYRYNGTVAGLQTVFSVAGSPTEIGQFFEKVTASLRKLPLDRLQFEARILRTEAASRRPGFIDHLLGRRYGPKQWGLSAYDEYGLNDPDPSAVQAWADQWFTAGNAALWISGSEVPSFSLELPDGPRKEPPVVPDSPIPLPAWLSSSSDGVGMCMVAARSTAFLLLQGLLGKRARTRLRYGEAVSYHVSTNYVPLSRDLAHFAIWADALPESALAVTSGLLEVVDQLAADGPRVDELKSALSITKKELADPVMVFILLNAAATNELLGSEDLSAAQIFQELEAATPQDLAQQLSRAWETAIVAVPHGVAMPEPRFTRVPSWSSHQIRGRRYDLRKPPLDANDAYWLVVSDEGISVIRASGKCVTVLYQDCAALLRWTDGRRTLIGNDGFVVDVFPAELRGGEALYYEIDGRLPANLVVPMGDRDGEVSVALSVNRVPRSLRTLAPGVLVVVVLLCWFGVFATLFVAISEGFSVNNNLGILIYLTPAVIGTGFVIHRYRPGTFARIMGWIRRT